MTINEPPSGHPSRPNLLLSVPNGQAPNGREVLEVSPNDPGSTPIPLPDEPNSPVSIPPLDRGVFHKLPPEVQAA